MKRFVKLLNTYCSFTDKPKTLNWFFDIQKNYTSDALLLTRKKAYNKLTKLEKIILKKYIDINKYI